MLDFSLSISNVELVIILQDTTSYFKEVNQSINEYGDDDKEKILNSTSKNSFMEIIWHVYYNFNISLLLLTHIVIMHYLF